MSVTRLNDFRAAPGKESALRAFLGDVVIAVQGAPGCESVKLLLDQEDEAHFVIVETWADVAAHKAAAGRIPPEKLAEFMPLIASPPTGKYYDPA
jgi:quinol monooxygenase YgiN